MAINMYIYVDTHTHPHTHASSNKHIEIDTCAHINTRTPKYDRMVTHTPRHGGVINSGFDSITKIRVFLWVCLSTVATGRSKFCH